MSTYLYAVGTVRWKKHTGSSDVRRYRANKGWDVDAMCIDSHPITGRQFRKSQWWLREEYVGENGK